MKTKIQIKSTWGRLLYEHEAEYNSVRKTIEEEKTIRLKHYLLDEEMYVAKDAK